MCAGEPFCKEMQAALAIAELLQRSNRGDNIVTISAGLTVPLAHVMQLLFERKPTGILRMPAIDHIAQRRYALGLALEPDRTDTFAIDGGDLLACAQIGDGAGAFSRRYSISDAATRSAL